MAANDNIDDAIEIGVGHGCSGWEAQTPVKQILGHLSAHNSRWITQLTPN